MTKKEKNQEQIIREWIESNEVVPGDPGANRIIRGEHRKRTIREEIAKYDTNANSPLAARIRQIHQDQIRAQLRVANQNAHLKSHLSDGGSGGDGGFDLCSSDPGPCATHLKHFGELD